MKRHIALILIIGTALFNCGFNWSFGLVKDKCGQARKIVNGWTALKDEAKREEEEKQVLALCPSGSAGHYVKGLRFEKDGDLDRAIDEYRQSVKGDPSFARAEGDLGLAYLKKGSQDEAALALTRALGNINDPRYNKAMGDIYSDRKFYPLALHHYGEAMKELPGDADLHIGLAEIYSNQKRTDKAEGANRQTIALESGKEKAKTSLAKSLEVWGVPPKAGITIPPLAGLPKPTSRTSNNRPTQLESKRARTAWEL
jgi:tetratricopeptide (TPR) repeat protein